MTLPSAPHITTNWTQVVAPIAPGEKNSWRVYALQRALISRGYKVMDDGDYDPDRGTERALRKFQDRNDLFVDGIAGPLTQNALLRRVEIVVDKRHPNVPAGVIIGINMKETSGFIAPTNDFDPSSSDLGTDIGAMQWRVAGPPYNFEALKAGFDPERAMERAVTDPDKGLIPRFKRISSDQPNMGLELRWRSTIVGHNAPFLYEQMVDHGHLETPNAIAEWTRDPVTGAVRTHQQQFDKYSSDVIKFGHVHF